MKWKYKIITITKNAGGLDTLNANGKEGWEVIWLKENDNDFKVLLKRRYE